MRTARRGLDADAPLLGRHHRGTSALHRARPGAKLAGLALVGLAAGLARAQAPAPAALGVLGLLCAGVAAVALAAGLGAAYLAGQLRRLWVVLVLLAAVQWATAGPLDAVAVVAALVGCVWAAATVTGTTPVPVLLDAVVSALRPLRRVGVDPDRIGLALLLAVTSIPVVAGLLVDSRAAAAARGLPRDPRAVLVPTVLRTVAHAHAVSEALAARGLVDD
ncbi:CbiQ family ECF transporter T component [Kineococcus rubinsiae]|uniref:CbiQ family ECF transporter T component n=1 Tax=Kineococcus rubinsiae TaxID=2609562 RepID=UPI001AD93C79|nr:CbiQ family ECF transporter T component [Kineococcus rubinsiae]